MKPDTSQCSQESEDLNSELREPKIKIAIKGNHEAHHIYNPKGIAPTVREMHGKVTKILDVLGRLDYNPKSENIIYGWMGKHEFYGGFQTDVLFFDKPNNSDLHPTMKPIELLKTLITHGSRENGIVYDGFGGSGSTLIACEQTNRICYMMELDPTYCSVIIERWENLTNEKAVKLA